jgi:(heptosyl)LPS beta-1,4-glucosyltransferase
MKNKPNISVVVNVRNEVEHLSKCLKSISDFADEIVVVDMKSTDGSI